MVPRQNCQQAPGRFGGQDRVTSMKRLVVLVFVVGAGALGEPPIGPPAPASLSDFFKPGLVFQDRNGDGVVDFVNARLALPEKPTAAELSAAADVAARLGFGA